MEKCQQCQFYDRQNVKPNDGKVTQWGQCRREAPMLHPINAKTYMIEGVWPHVRDDDWCGEWKMATRRVDTRITEVSTGPLVPGVTRRRLCLPRCPHGLRRCRRSPASPRPVDHAAPRPGDGLIRPRGLKLK